jgi:hypothetical protein
MPRIFFATLDIIFADVVEYFAMFIHMYEY